MAQKSDTINIKPSKETRRKSKNIIDSLDRNQHDTLQHIKKVKKKNAVTIGSDQGDLILDYKLGTDSAKIVLYNNDSQKIKEYRISGSGHTIIIYNMDNMYIYDLFINGQLITTKKVTRIDSDSKSAHRNWALPK